MPLPDKTVIFDLDGTLTRRDTYLSFLIGYLQRHPLRLFHVLHLPFAVIACKISLRDNSWLKEVFLKAVLKGATREAIHHWVESYTNILLEKGMRQGAMDRLFDHQKAGDRLILASASLDLYVVTLGRKLGFEDVICTQTGWDSKNQLTGALFGKNCYGDEKLIRVKSWMNVNGSSKIIIAYSDHHTDISLLEWAHNSVAVNPTKELVRLVVANKNIVLAWW